MKGERSHMKIKTMVNFKLRNNAPLMLKGIYDDSEEPFPKEIYEEIERNKSGKRRTLVILDDGKPKKVPAPASAAKPMEMLDKSAEIQTVESEPVPEPEEKAEETKPEAQDSTESVETESDTTKKKKRTAKKRTTTKSTTAKSTTKKRAPKKKKTDE
jgi:hypothetical protein